jgi:nickel-type superoxide dismutase maturation protease
MDPDGATLPRLTGAHSGIRWSRRAPIAAVALATTVALAARSLRRVVVVGGSMAPTLLEGDRLLVVAPLWGGVRVYPGDLVVLPDPRPGGRALVKRVVAVDPGAGTVEVRGDAPDASTDSRTFGPVPLGSLVGRVVYRYGPPDRSGPPPRPKEYDRT